MYKISKQLLLGLCLLATVDSEAQFLPVNNGRIWVRNPKVMLEQVNASQLNELLNLSKDFSFQISQQRKDDLGFTHEVYQQYYKDVKVHNAFLQVHSKHGKITGITGKIAESSTLQVGTVSISPETAKAAAMEAFQMATVYNQYPVETYYVLIGDTYKLVHSVRLDGANAQQQNVFKQVWLSTENGQTLFSYDLVHNHNVNSKGLTFYRGEQDIVVDSVDTAHYQLFDDVRNIGMYDGQGRRSSRNGNSRLSNLSLVKNTSSYWGNMPAVMQIKVDTLQAGFSSKVSSTLVPFMMVEGDLNDSTRLRIKAAEYFSGQRYAPFYNRNSFIFENSGFENIKGSFGLWNTANDAYADTVQFDILFDSVGVTYWSGKDYTGTYTIDTLPNPAVDIYWGLSKAYDYYKTYLNRNSYDDRGSVIRGVFDGAYTLSQTQNNAFAYGPPYNQVIFGLGDGYNYNPFVGLDIVAHEFTHLVVNYSNNGGLIYSGESGALNESFADVFGACVEYHTDSANFNWLIGEDVFKNVSSALRSMSTPKTFRHPNTYGKTYWQNPNNTNVDNGGVHTNSSLQNLWFHLLCEGGTGRNDNKYNYNVEKIGMEKAQHIAYRNLMEYLGPNATYEDAYEGSLMATLDLFNDDTTSVEFLAVREAWYAVGVGGGKAANSIENVTVDADIDVYPNPAKDVLTIDLKTIDKAQYEISNINGQLLEQGVLGANKNQINVQNLGCGIHFLVIKDTKGSAILRDKISIIK